MPSRALRHFEEDIDRVSALLDHATSLPEGLPSEQLLRDDVLRSAWVLAVGAMDAYFCDAYADLVAATMITAQRQGQAGSSPVLTDKIRALALPVATFFESYVQRDNWKWRMAAREMISRSNFLSVFKQVDDTLNLFLPAAGRLFKGDSLGPWLSHSEATARLMGTSRRTYRALTEAKKQQARTKAVRRLKGRLGAIVQRRHDCVHNCDRPDVAPQPIRGAQMVRQAVIDTEFFVHRSDEQIEQQFPVFLKGMGAAKTNIRSVGYPTKHL